MILIHLKIFCLFPKQKNKHPWYFKPNFYQQSLKKQRTPIAIIFPVKSDFVEVNEPYESFMYKGCSPTTPTQLPEALIAQEIKDKSKKYFLFAFYTENM
jgi:hypothetical protein